MTKPKPAAPTIDNDWKPKVTDGDVVPIEWLPVGTLIEIKATEDFIARGGSPARPVGLPQVREDGTVVFRYRDIAWEWDYLERGTEVKVLDINPAKAISPRMQKILTAEAKAAK